MTFMPNACHMLNFWQVWQGGLSVELQASYTRTYSLTLSPHKTMAMQPSLYRMHVRPHLHASESDVLLIIIFDRV